MAIKTAIGTPGNDAFDLGQFGEPGNNWQYLYDGGTAGADTMYFDDGSGGYANKFKSTNFTIGAVNGNGEIIVSGASTGGTNLTFTFKSVETLVFSDKTVTLTYSTPVDTTPPTVTAFSPADAATGVNIASNIVVTFSEAIAKGTGLIELHSGSAAGPVVESYNAATSTNLTVTGNTLTINPTANLSNGTHYFVTFASGSIKDSAGNDFAGTSTYDFTTIFVDTTPPTVTAFSPFDSATGVDIGSNIVVTFSETIAKGTGLIELRSGSAAGPVVESYNAATSTNLTVTGNTLTINPTANLSNGTQYFVTFASGTIKDSAGNNFAGTSTYDFTTIAAADTTPPTVTAFSPADAATGVDISSNIVVTFSEAIAKGTGLIELHSGSAAGPVVESYNAATSTNLTVTGNTLTINPTANLANGTQYFVTLASGSIKDSAGNNFAGTSTYDFTTIAAVDTTPPTVTAFSPADAATGVGIGSDIVVTFSEAIAKGTGLIELHSGSAAGPVVESYNAATSTNLTVTGNTLTINPTANLSTGTHYFVTLASGSIKDSAGNNYAGTSTYDFTTISADTTPPTVTAFSPADAETGVDISSNIVVTFSEAIAKGTGLIELHSGSAAGPVVESYNAATSTNLTVTGNTLTINPTANLSNATHYFVTLASGSIKDSIGNNYAGTSTYDFTTISADTTPPTVTAFSPADAATGVDIGSDIVVTFSEAIAKGTGLIELHSGSAAGPVFESYNAATSTNLTVTGNTLTINPTANLATGTHYFVTLASGSIKDSTGNNYAGTSTYDFTTGLFTTPLTPMNHNGISVIPERYTGPATAAGGAPIDFQFIGDSSNEVLIGTAYNDFINVGGGVDAVNAGVGNDVIDGGTGSNFLTGGAGTDIFFSDGRGGATTWSTITDWQAGEQLSVWGWTPGTSRIVEWVQAGAAGYEGLTMHADLNGDGSIDTSVTFTGIVSQSQLPAPLEFDGLLWFV